MVKLEYNPFIDSAIANYDQFKRYKFLEVGIWNVISNRVENDINMIRNNFPVGERTILIGQRGLGKSTTLYAIKEKLEKSGMKNHLFTNLIEGEQHFKDVMGDTIGGYASNPVFLLFDFPDTIELRTYKKFLEFLWTVITHRQHSNINLIFAMNNSHYERAYSYSEIFGKFITHRLENLSLEETRELIISRLSNLGVCEENIFDTETIKIIYGYSTGIPRNVISACNVLVSNSNGERINSAVASKILREKYIDQLIGDRVEDKVERKIYIDMIEILKNDFKGCVEMQKDYLEVTIGKLGIGQVTLLRKIDDLIKWGVFKYYKGGDKRRNKILSLE